MSGKDGHLSFQTLVIASLSSAAAALLTSLFWESGTVFSAAFTPVIVSIVGEALKRPAKGISKVRTARRDQGASVPSPAAGEPVAAGPAPSPVRGEGRPQARPGYARFGGRRVNMRVALATGALAFVIAAAVLTLPELLTGESIAGQPGRTTLGGGSSVDRSEDGGSPVDESEAAGESEAGAEGADGDAPPDDPASGAAEAGDGEEPAPESGTQQSPAEGQSAPPSDQRSAPGGSSEAPSAPAPPSGGQSP